MLNLGRSESRLHCWLLLLTILYFWGVWTSLLLYHHSHFKLFWWGAVLLLFLVQRSISPLLDATIIYCAFWLLYAYKPELKLLIYLSLSAFVLLMASFPLRSRLISILVTLQLVIWLGSTLWFTGGSALSAEGIFIIFTIIISLIVHCVEGKGESAVHLKKVDVILCSYSGNTAHYAEQFCAGLRQGGTEVQTHRFHYHQEFTAQLSGDALVVAYPVIGWKPPWPLNYYLRVQLPRGNGKPAFILYSAAGGAENAHVLAWLWLTLKGYRVRGRLWSVYPLNVPTFRLGPRKMWQFIDRIWPLKLDQKLACQAGLSFARGLPSGSPFFIFPFPLIPLGLLTDNRWIDIFIYRNHVWKKRCNSCELCVKFCPQQRLSMVNGVPKAKGTCNLCLGCINLCPQRAMEMTGWTEYGQQYKPRWPRLVVKKKKKKSAD
ncbi:hypothetical protein ACFL27_22255 [candidate division CSSED10-310 bacterium]|uniref:4Fe-4S ferredoxin-type domain-containing protein n=1 Tax=candidate division CSSED10-310 bacterium TaxID=2855610 RepID=A0ABV6Z3L1_UNCC1